MIQVVDVETTVWRVDPVLISTLVSLAIKYGLPYAIALAQEHGDDIVNALISAWNATTGVVTTVTTTITEGITTIGGWISGLFGKRDLETILNVVMALLDSLGLSDNWVQIGQSLLSMLG